MKRIGLTGAIGAGKSTVARVLAEAGVPVIEADALAHEALSVRAAEVCRTFPESCASGLPDRRRLAERVFADPAARRRLEAIVHPYVRERIEQELGLQERLGARLVVVEIPLLFETGWEKNLDGVLVVSAPAELRYRRLLARGLSEEEAKRREAAQLPPEEKNRRADWVIENEGDLETLKKRVLAWLKEVDP